MPEVMQAQPAEAGIGANRPPAVREYPQSPALGMSRKQERVGITRAGQRGNERPRGLAQRHGPLAGFRVAEFDDIPSNVAPAQIDHLAPAASGERQQPDRRDGLGPLVLAGVERAPEPGELVGVEESGRCCASGSS